MLPEIYVKHIHIHMHMYVRVCVCVGAHEIPILVY